MLKYNGEVFELNHFPDGTLRLEIPDTDSESCDDIGCIEWYYEREEELVALIYLVGQLRDNGCGSNLHLHLPYIPNARMDRIDPEDDAGTVFTLKHFAALINSLNFKAVFVLDPHSSVAAALIDRVVFDSPSWRIDDAMDAAHPDLLYFPDEGSCKRYIPSFADMPYAFGVKKRDWSTGEILGLDVIANGNDISGKNILIVDDICSRGGTFYHSAKKLKELGAASVSLYVTHCENTILSGNLLEGDLIDRVYTTNSIFTGEHPKIEVMKL